MNTSYNEADNYIEVPIDDVPLSSRNLLTHKDDNMINGMFRYESKEHLNLPGDFLFRNTKFENKFKPKSTSKGSLKSPFSHKGSSDRSFSKKGITHSSKGDNSKNSSGLQL